MNYIKHSLRANTRLLILTHPFINKIIWCIYVVQLSSKYLLNIILDLVVVFILFGYHSAASFPFVLAKTRTQILFVQLGHYFWTNWTYRCSAGSVLFHFLVLGTSTWLFALDDLMRETIQMFVVLDLLQENVLLGDGFWPLSYTRLNRLLISARIGWGMCFIWNLNSRWISIQLFRFGDGLGLDHLDLNSMRKLTWFWVYNCLISHLLY